MDRREFVADVGAVAVTTGRAIASDAKEALFRDPAEAAAADGTRPR